MNFNSLILSWFDKNGRHLPWRDNINPYNIWVSEIILQQTRVNQGLEYYNRFMISFPTVFHLALAPEDDVLRAWQGLGYYSRARNMQSAAKYITHELNGIFPDTYHALQQLKGVGKYTAAAISSICFNETVPAIDGNAYRVYSRYLGITSDISQSNAFKLFFEAGSGLIDDERPGDFNQAVMDLGAMICLPRNPKCKICPVESSCYANANHLTDSLPLKTKKIKVRQRYFNFIYINDGTRFLLKKRTGKDIWTGLFVLNLLESDQENHEVTDNKVFDEKFIDLMKSERHILSHQILNINYWNMEVGTAKLEELAEKYESVIVSRETIDAYPLPKPIEKFLQDEFC